MGQSGVLWGAMGCCGLLWSAVGQSGVLRGTMEAPLLWGTVLGQSWGAEGLHGGSPPLGNEVGAELRFWGGVSAGAPPL